MLKIKKIFTGIRIEEYFLFLNSLFLLFLYFLFFQPSFNWFDDFARGLVYLKLGTKYFIFVFYFLIFILFLKIWFWSAPKIIESLEKKIFLISIFEINNIFQGAKGILPLLKLLLGVSLFFSAVGAILGFFISSTKERLVNNQLIEIDRFLFGHYPFIWFQSPGNFLKNFDFLFIKSFLFLGFMLGATLVLFYLSRKRKFLSQYIIAVTSTVLIALPFWFFFPSNSPQNAFLNNVYEKEINTELEKSINYYQPTNLALNFQREIGEKQKTAPPISTFPSMHVAWAIIIVYLTFQYNRKTIFFTLPWVIFSSLGTVFLAQHYFIDFLAAFPVAGISLWFSSFLVQLEKKYYQNPEQDLKEKDFKVQIKKDLTEILFLFGIDFSKFKKLRLVQSIKK